MKKFFLMSDCLNPPKIWRECEVVSEHSLIENGATVFLVKVDPVFESDVVEKNIFSHVLIGMTSPKWSLDRVGDPYFMVDIMCLSNDENKLGRKLSMKEVRALGMGTVSDKVEPQKKRRWC